MTNWSWYVAQAGSRPYCGLFHFLLIFWFHLLLWLWWQLHGKGVKSSNTDHILLQAYLLACHVVSLILKESEFTGHGCLHSPGAGELTSLRQPSTNRKWEPMDKCFQLLIPGIISQVNYLKCKFFSRTLLSRVTQAKKEISESQQSSCK